MDRTDSGKTCGIIMPISHFDETHTAEHWDRVKCVFAAAIRRSGLFPKPVWEGGQHDVIQSRILQNIFENEVVICDISTRNPNVMLEWGMRLTTKKPTIVVAENGTPIPFDTSAIHTIFYDSSLEWGATQTFILELSDRVSDIIAKFDAGEYRSYLETFQFERVEPGTKTISENEAVMERLDDVAASVSRLTRHVQALKPVTIPAPDHLLAFAQDFATTNIPLPSGHDTAGRPAQRNYVVGDRVRHAKFGEGVVSAVEGNKLEINFNHCGIRRVMNSFVDAMNLDTKPIKSGDLF